MADRKFTVIGDNPAYGFEPGGSFTADEDDLLIQLNVEAGVIALAKDVEKTTSAGMTCPACVEAKKKNPPSLADADALAEHYADEHPALAIPDWRNDK